jgi:hypothetical protein
MQLYNVTSVLRLYKMLFGIEEEAIKFTQNLNLGDSFKMNRHSVNSEIGE